MGWVIALLLAGATGALLMAASRRAETVLAAAAVMLTGLAGYAWQGHPDLAGVRERAAEAGAREDTVFALERAQWLGAYGHDADRLAYADALERNGMVDEAVSEMTRFAAQSPRSMPLALGLANALFVKGGSVTPPVALAYEQAARLAPGDPAPPYFFGLSLALSGRFDEAAATWRALLGSAPPTAPWRPTLSARLDRLDRLRRLSEGGNGR